MSTARKITRAGISLVAAAGFMGSGFSVFAQTLAKPSSGISPSVPEYSSRDMLIKKILEIYRRAQQQVNTGRDCVDFISSISADIKVSGGFNISDYKKAGLTENSIRSLLMRGAVNSIRQLMPLISQKLATGEDAYSDIESLARAIGRAGDYNNSSVKQTGVTAGKMIGYLKANSANAAVRWFREAENKVAAGEDALDELTIVRKSVEGAGGYDIKLIKAAGVTAEKVALLDAAGAVFTAKIAFSKAKAKADKKQNNDIELVEAARAIKRAGGFEKVGITADHWGEAGGPYLPNEGKQMPTPEQIIKPSRPRDPILDSVLPVPSKT